MSDQILVCVMVGDILVHVAETLNRLLMSALNSNKKIDNLIKSLLKKLVFRTIEKIRNTLEILKRIA